MGVSDHAGWNGVASGNVLPNAWSAGQSRSAARLAAFSIALRRYAMKREVYHEAAGEDPPEPDARVLTSPSDHGFGEP
jgi:copper oxidase (laccase) domain-containing protein